MLREEIMKNTQFKADDIFCDNKNKDTFSQDQLKKLNNFFGKNDVIININIKFNLFKPREKSNIY